MQACHEIFKEERGGRSQFDLVFVFGMGCGAVTVVTVVFVEFGDSVFAHGMGCGAVVVVAVVIVKVCKDRRAQHLTDHAQNIVHGSLVLQLCTW